MNLPPRVLRAGLRAARPLFMTRHLSIDAKRRMVDVLSGGAKPPAEACFARTTVAGVPVERITFLTPQNGMLIYLHGGGYALGSARGYRTFASHVAQAAGMDALVPDYSRSPEARFPHALEEMIRLYEEVLERVDPGDVVIAGDSAGGGMALALAMQLRDRGIAAPAAIGLICPWADLALDIDRRRPPRTDPLIVPSLTADWSVPYVVGSDPTVPGISPALGDMTGLPPIVMHSASDDPIAADAETIEAAFAADPDAGHLDHRVFDDLWHVFHLQIGFLGAADQAVADLGAALADLRSSSSSG